MQITTIFSVKFRYNFENNYIPWPIKALLGIGQKDIKRFPNIYESSMLIAVCLLHKVKNRKSTKYLGI